MTPERFWQLSEASAARARSSGALHPIATQLERVEDQGVEFLLRVVDNLKRKQSHAGASGAATDPFLPYDPALYVADLSPNHVLLLNKFNVLPLHVVIVTRRFELQTSALTELDFAALSQGMAARPALGFYNAGEAAGASQTHKHLQLVPLPLDPGAPELPIATALAQGAPDTPVSSSQPFRHASLNFELDWSAGVAPRRLHAHYLALLEAAGLDVAAAASGGDPGRYNLLVTNSRMWLVPRVRARVDGVSLNALAYAGALLVKDAETRQRLLALGPMRALREAAGG